MEIVALLLSLSSLAVSCWTVWFARTHWPASGFVRVPKEVAQDRISREARAQSMADRTVADGGLRPTSRVRKGRMSGRRMRSGVLRKE